MNIKKVLFLGLALITAHNSCAMETPDVPQEKSVEDLQRQLNLSKQRVVILQDRMSKVERLKQEAEEALHNSKLKPIFPQFLNPWYTLLIKCIDNPGLFDNAYKNIDAKITTELTDIDREAITTQERLKIQEMRELVRDKFYHPIWKEITIRGVSSVMSPIHLDIYNKILDLNRKIEEYLGIVATTKGPKGTESHPENTQDYLKNLLEQQNQEREARKARLAKKQGTENNSAKSIQAVVPASPSAPLVKQHAKAAHRPQRPEFLQQINAGNFSLKATPAQVKSKKEKTLATVLETALDLRRSHIESDEEN